MKRWRESGEREEAHHISGVLEEQSIIEVDAEAERWRKEKMVEVEVPGVWPAPVYSFDALAQRFPHLPIAPALLSLLNSYPSPTPVQSQVLPAALSRTDLLVSAPTGSGKTLGFGIPLSILLSALPPPLPSSHFAHALVLAPTRELAAQLHTQLSRILRAACPSHRVVRLVGGEASAAQEAEVRGASLVVATPGRLLQFLQRHNALLSQLCVLVLDEADRLLAAPDMEEQVRAILSQCASTNRLTWLFSATVPASVERIARSASSPVLRLQVGSSSRPPLELDVRVQQLASSARFPALLRVLRSTPTPPALIFCNTHEGVVHLGRLLRAEQFHVAILHALQEHAQRLRAVCALRDGGADLLVASPLAARGLDFPGLSLVVLYDTPPSAPELLHRAGRTGRGGHVGRVECFLNPGGIAPDVRILLLDLGLAPQALPASRDDLVR